MFSLTTTVALTVAMLATSLLSGIFGMAGGMILMGILIALLPLPAAMVLHGVSQLASNGWRAWLWRHHVNPRIAIEYIIGAVIALSLSLLVKYVPEKPYALISLGLLPFIARAIPDRLTPDMMKRGHSVLCGIICVTVQITTGIAGPLLDTYFIRSGLDRKAIVATKASVQVFGHISKLIYFGALIDEAVGVDPVLAAIAIVCAVVGTTLASRVLEVMTEAQFRKWTNLIITCVALTYIANGLWLLIR